MNHLKNKKGFTLIEILIVVVILAVVSIAAFDLSTRRDTTSLNNASQQIIASFHEAQSRALSGQGGTSWGVHLDNTASATPFYALFKTSYSAANTVGHYPLPQNVQYTSIPVGSSTDIIFAQTSGLPQISTSTSIVLQLVPETTPFTINMNVAGVINFSTSTIVVASTSSIGTIGAWSTTTPLPSRLSLHSAVVYNGYIYTTGGRDAAHNATTTVFYAPINSDGSLGAWTRTTALPSAINSHSAVVYNGYIYSTGGEDFSSNLTSTVFYAPINSTGSIGSWKPTTKLPKVLFDHSAAVYNGYIYITGGNAGEGVPTSTVFYAPINSTGSLGAWTRTTALPSPIAIHSVVVNNGYIYTTGGTPDAISSIASVFFAPINSTGSLGAWQSATDMPSALFFHSAVVYSGYIYVTGGTPDNFGPVSTVYSAPISSTSSVGAWKTTTALPSAIESHSAVLYNGYVYTTGGDTGSLATSTVFYAPFGN